jgi:hypothetical protein
VASRKRIVGFVILLCLGLASTALHAWQAHSAPYGCIDSEGHGPDPGTNECNRSIQYAVANRSAHVRSTIVVGLFWLGALAFIYCLIWMISARLDKKPPDHSDGPLSGQV